MKRTKFLLTLLAILVFSILFTGCGQKFTPDTSPEYKFETDCQYNQYYTLISAFMTESEDSYYYLEDSLIHVIDKKTMQDTVLCGKPNCLHGKDLLDSGVVNPNIECNAYVNGLTSAICYYNGALYTVTKRPGETAQEYTPVFTRIAVDGSSRKNLFDVNFGAKEELEPGTYEFFIHRGIVYFASGFAKRDKNTYIPEIVDYRLYSYNLTTKKTEKLYSAAVEDGHWDYVYAVGNNIYFVGSAYESVEEFHVLRFNLSTKETNFFEHGQRVLPVGDKLLYYHINITLSGEEENYQHWLEVSSLDGSDKQVYSKLDLNDVPLYLKHIQTDGKYIFVADSNGAPETTEIRTYDFRTGAIIATIPIPEKAAPMGDRTMHCSQDGKLWMYSVVGLDENGFLPRTFFYCNISDIGTPDFQWYEVEKIN